MANLLDNLVPEAHPASVSTRWTAAFIDYLLFVIVMSLLMYVFGDVVTNERGSVSYHVEDAKLLLVVCIPWIVLFPVLETINGGQTIGKAFMKIKVVKDDFSKPGFGILLLRRLFDCIDYLPFFGLTGVLVATNTTKKQRVGDLVAKTFVVQA